MYAIVMQTSETEYSTCSSTPDSVVPFGQCNAGLGEHNIFQTIQKPSGQTGSSIVYETDTTYYFVGTLLKLLQIIEVLPEIQSFQ